MERAQEIFRERELGGEMEVRSGRRSGVMRRTPLASLNLSHSSRAPVRGLELDRRAGREAGRQVAKTWNLG